MIAPHPVKQPWKHPAVWPAHMVTKKYEAVDGADVSVATCECGWASRVAIGRGGGGFVAQDDAIDAHWQNVIAAAATVSA